MPKFAANLTMLFNEMPFLDRFAAAKAAGFTGVEYLFPYDFDRAVLREQLDSHGLTQVLHNLPAGNWAAGERGIAILPDRVAEFRDGVFRAIDFAKALDCEQLNCLVGIAPDEADPRELQETLVGNLRFAASTLARENIKLLVEPINTLDIPGFHLHGTEQAVQLISEVRSNNLFIQYDIYHMQIMEGDVIRTIRQHYQQIGHYHTGGVPGRHELDETQELNWRAVMMAIADTGFTGFVAHEFTPTRDPLTSLQEAVRTCDV
jgi:hydroxypyruvate isomerase